MSFLLFAVFLALLSLGLCFLLIRCFVLIPLCLFLAPPPFLDPIDFPDPGCFLLEVFRTPSRQEIGALLSHTVTEINTKTQKSALKAVLLMSTGPKARTA